MANRRHSLVEFLTSACVLDFLSRLQSLAGFTRKAFKADFRQRSVLEWPTNLADVPNHSCLREVVDRPDMLFTVAGCLRIISNSDGQDVCRRMWKAPSFKLHELICKTLSAD